MGVSDLLTLRVAGKVFSGWKSVQVRLGIEQVAGAYELGITERWPDQPDGWDIPPGESCEILVGDNTVISGYVDTVSVSYDATSHDIRVSGRDRTGDLVDCSAPSTAYSGLTFLQIATRLTEPFGIAVTDQTGGGSRLPKFSVQNGESVFRTLEKLARSEGVLLVSDSNGGLLITRAGLAGDCSSVLRFGQNILRAQSDHTHASLYSSITVKGQAASAAASLFDVTNAHPAGAVTRDSAVASGGSRIGRHRPLILVAETQADSRRCRQRAEWEASNREARARRITVTVQGWRQQNGELWKINQRVRVVCPWMHTDEMWLIGGVTFRLDDGGSLADLHLVGEKSFDLLPEIPQPKAAAQQSEDGDAGAGKFRVIR